MQDNNTLHDGNVLRALITDLYMQRGDLIDLTDKHANALDVVKKLETTIVRLNTQLREHRAPEPKSRDGREVTRLRQVTGNLLDSMEVPEAVRDDVVARLSHPVTSPIEILDSVLTDHIERDTDMGVPKPVSVSKHRSWERGYN